MIKKVIFILFIIMSLNFISACEDNIKKYFYFMDDKERFLEETKLDEFAHHDVIPVYLKLCGMMCWPTNDAIAYFEPVYFITNAEEFNNIRKYPNKRYIIANDIDLSSFNNFQPIGTKEKPFSGEISTRFIDSIKQYDFQNGYGKDLHVQSESYFYRNYNETMFTVKNVNISINDDNYTEYVGVFGYITGYIHDITFHNVSINVNSTLPTYAGIVGGYSDGVVSKRILVNQSNITGNYAVGGVYGGVTLPKLDFSTDELGLNNSVAINPVTEKSYVGGYVGIFDVMSNWVIDQDKYIANSDIEFSVIDNDLSSNIIIGGIYGKVNSLSDYDFESINEAKQYNSQIRIYGILNSSLVGENYNFGSFIGELSLKTVDNLENIEIDIEMQMYTFVSQNYPFVYLIENESGENLVFTNKSTGKLIDDFVKLDEESNCVGYYIEEYDEYYFGYYLKDLLAVLGVEYNENNHIKIDNED